MRNKVSKICVLVGTGLKRLQGYLNLLGEMRCKLMEEGGYKAKGGGGEC